jgi:diacylglycerol kinase family enzyme
MQIGVITNPYSRRNRNRPNRAAELQSIVGNLGEVHETRSPEAIKPILRDFLRRRARFWVADGGDGALHWMVKAGFEVLEEDEFKGGSYTLPLTVPTGGGTINFVTSNVGIRGRAEQILLTLRGAVESGCRLEEVEVDSMLIEGVEKTEQGNEPFRTYGFASAAGGVGQRFYSKYYAAEDPNPRTIVKVIAQALASLPVALSPLRHVPGLPRELREYARDLLEPCRAKVTLDGMILPQRDFTGIHLASMSINLGGVLRLFSKADQAGFMHCLLGSPSPLSIVRNLPNLHLGRELRGKNVVDRLCREMTIEAIGDELLEPVIDGEYYRNLKKVTFRIGPRVRIPKVVGSGE